MWSGADGGQLAKEGGKVKEKRGIGEWYYITSTFSYALVAEAVPLYIRVYMNAVSSKTFKSGNSIAVRLPKEIAYPADINVVIERAGDVLTIRPSLDPAAEKRKLLDLVEALRAIGPADEIQKREPIEFPDRPGL